MTRSESGQTQSGWEQFATFGALLKHLRRRARLTQQQLGAAVGYSYTYIARLESGQRQPEAATVAARFVEALGLEHEPELAQRLVELAVQARGQVVMPIPAAPAGAVGDPAASKPPTNLLPHLTRLIGREADLADVQRLISAYRLVTLTGTGGVGKTRLAQETGQVLLSEFADGVWLVELAALSEPDQIPNAVTQVLSLPDQPGRTPAQALIAHLADKRVLLLLDNCEHLAVACAELVERLLRACPGVRVLATSREPLRVPSEVTWRVPSLGTPDPHHPLPPERLLDYPAAQLFVERAGATQGVLRLTPGDSALVARICHRLDGIPLALELAAARLAGLSLNELAMHLEGRLDLLAGGSRSALPRHQTLRATLDWSYDLLSEQERILLARLSVFAGGWTAEAAETVCAGEGLIGKDILGLLLGLVDHSLVVTVEDREEHGNSARMRYRMLEPVRQYATERLEESGSAEAERLRSRHLEYSIVLWQQSDPDVHGSERGTQRVLAEAIAQEYANYQAAMAWSLTTPVEDERGLVLSGSLEMIAMNQGRLWEGHDWLKRALAKWTRPTLAHAMALRTAGLVAAVLGDFRMGRVYLTESIRLARLVADPFCLADALLRLALLVWKQVSTKSIGPDELEEMADHVDDALRIGREHGFQPIVGYAMSFLAGSAFWQGRLDEAYRLIRESAASHRACGHDAGLINSLWVLGQFSMAEQDWSQALMHLEESDAIAQGNGHLPWHAAMSLELARVARERHDYAQAERLLDECRVMSQEMGSWQASVLAGMSRPDVLSELGRTVQLRGDVQRAATLLREAVDLSREAGQPVRLILSLNFKAALLLDRDNPAEAAARYAESLQLSADVGSPFGVAVGLAGLAEVARRRGELERAARLCGAAAGRGKMSQLAVADFGWVYVPSDWLEYDRTMEAMRELLADPVIAAVWAEGERMTVPQAMAFAIGISGG